MGKARKFSPEFKAQIALAILSGAKSRAEISQEHQIADAALERWTAEVLKRAPNIFDPKYAAERNRSAKLERLTKKQALQLEIAEEAGRILRSLPPEDEE